MLAAHEKIANVKSDIENKYFQYRDISHNEIYNCSHYIPHISIGSSKFKDSNNLGPIVNPNLQEIQKILNNNKPLQIISTKFEYYLF
jgi:hypothetical protein